MSTIPVNRKKQLSRVLSVRMTEQEFKDLQETIKNYEIRRDSFSECVRGLLSRDLHRSRRFRRALKEQQPQKH
jgi:hypothetical protein